MTSLINRLLGKDENSSHSHTNDTHGDSGTCTTSSCSTKQGGTRDSGLVTEGRSVQHDGVNIKSTISSDTSSTVSLANQQKLNDLVTRLGATHSQIDDYAKQQTDKINADVQREIDQVVQRTRQDQEDLLHKANEHTAQIDTEYRAQLQKMVEQIDASKAKKIAEIEKDLNSQQAAILTKARNEIDKLNKKAADLKIGVLEQAQAKASSDANEITAQAAHLNKASTIHQSTGTTTIKTEVSAATTTKESGSATVASGARNTSDTKTVETSRQQSKETKM